MREHTYQKGRGSTFVKVIEGSLYGNTLTGTAGVANIGTDLNWTGHPFAQANWYGFGRLAWNPEISAETIAEEWLGAIYSNDRKFLEPIKQMMPTLKTKHTNNIVFIYHKIFIFNILY